jgi:hypothetical protein
MRLTAVISEVWRNLRSRTTRPFILMIALTSLLGGLSIADLISVTSISEDADAYRMSGGSTVIYSALGRIDGTACDALDDIPGVHAAGALRSASAPLTPLLLPDNPIPTFEVSPHFGSFAALSISRRTPGALISDQVEEALDVERSGILNTAQGDVQVGSVYTYTEDGRRPGLGYAVLLPTDARAAFDECWIEIWPESEQLNSILRTTLIPGHDSPGTVPPEVAQLNSSLGHSFAGGDRFSDRITQYGAIVAAVLGLCLGFAGVRIRRLELASARHAGVRLGSQTVQIMLETTVWVLLGTLGAVFAVGVAAWIIAELSLKEVVLLVAPPMIAGVFAVLSGALVAVVVTREKELFRYFKDR